MNIALLVYIISFLLLFVLYSFFFLNYRKQFKGMTTWSYSFFAFFLGIILFIHRDAFPLNLSIIAGNLFLVSGQIFLNIGFRLFHFKPLTSRQIINYACFFMIYFIILILLLSFWNIYEFRVVLFCLANFFLYLDLMILNRNFAKNNYNKIYFFLGVAFLVMTLLTFFRMGTAIYSQLSHTPLSNSNLTEIFYFVIGQFICLSLGFLLMILINQKLFQTLQEATQKKNMIFSILSHDLRSPLATLYQFNQLLLENKDTSKDEWEKNFKHYQNTISKMSSLTDNLLNWALYEDSLKPHLKKHNLLSLLEQSLQFFTDKIKVKNIDMQIQIPKDLEVITDDNICETVLRNLLSNAVKYTPTGGRIQVTVTDTQKNYALAITDSGQGITPDLLPHIFELKHKKPSKGTDGEIGNGIGISLAYELFKKTNGTIMVESQSGSTTTFTLLFPK